MQIAESKDLGARLRRSHPELAQVRAAAAGLEVFLVGGFVRDLLLGRDRADIDLVVVGDAAELAARLGGADPAEHPRFSTAKTTIDGHDVDIASARTETYPRPGSLPEVMPANGIEADLRRRDFTINAMAVPLAAPSALIDPHGGREDLAAGLLRVLHPASFVDDPTRALRAARYASRFGLSLAPPTDSLVRAADLDTVSGDRRRAELLRLAAEPQAARGFELLAEWGLASPRPDGIRLAAEVAKLLDSPPWHGFAPRDRTVLAAALAPVGAEAELAAAPRPSRPSEGVALAEAHTPVQLAIARAMGADWLDRYVARWRSASLEIDGDDLLAVGIPQGPAIGRGLAAAMRLKLDGEIEGREQELATAIAAARRGAE